MTQIDPADLPLVMDQPHSVIEDVIIDGTGLADCQFGIYVHADHCIVRNVVVKNMPRIGIGIRGIDRVLVERAHVEYTGMQGIWVERDSWRTCVRNSLVKNSGKDNIQIAGAGGSVLNCEVENAGNGQPNFAGIYVAANARNTLVEGNSCAANGTGIDVSWGFQDGENRNGGPSSCGNVIHGNRSWMNNSCGITCASNGAIISGNQCLDNGVIQTTIPSSGIGLVNANGCVITGNVSDNTGLIPLQHIGLLFVVNGAGGNASRNCLISNNHFEGNIDFPVRQWFSRTLSPVSTTRGHIFANNFGV